MVLPDYDLTFGDFRFKYLFVLRIIFVTSVTCMWPLDQVFKLPIHRIHIGYAEVSSRHWEWWFNPGKYSFGLDQLEVRNWWPDKSVLAYSIHEVDSNLSIFNSFNDSWKKGCYRTKTWFKHTQENTTELGCWGDLREINRLKNLYKMNKIKLGLLCITYNV